MWRREVSTFASGAMSKASHTERRWRLSPDTAIMPIRWQTKSLLTLSLSDVGRATMLR